METLNDRAGRALGNRWQPGMLTTAGGRVTEVHRYGNEGPSARFYLAFGDVTSLDSPATPGAVWTAHGYDESQERNWTREAVAPIPDMEDPATLGAFLHVVREVWKDPCLTITYAHGPPLVWAAHGNDTDELPSTRSDSEAAALVLALEAGLAWAAEFDVPAPKPIATWRSVERPRRSKDRRHTVL